MTPLMQGSSDAEGRRRSMVAAGGVLMHGEVLTSPERNATKTVWYILAYVGGNNALLGLVLCVIWERRALSVVYKNTYIVCVLHCTIYGLHPTSPLNLNFGEDSNYRKCFSKAISNLIFAGHTLNI
jgi:hypothetical protein